MANRAVKLSEELAVVATVDPDALTAGDHDSDAVDMSKFNRCLFVLSVGTLGASATVDMKLQESPDGSTGWADISGKAITQLTQAGSDDDKQALLETRADELTDGQRYVRARVTVGTATSDGGMVALAGQARFNPASDDDLASVDEIVS